MPTDSHPQRQPRTWIEQCLAAVVIAASLLLLPVTEPVQAMTLAQAPDDEAEIEEIDVDENLFLLRLLDQYYWRLLNDPELSAESSYTRAAVRQQLSKLKHHITESESLDHRLIDLYSEFLEVMESYEQLLAEVRDAQPAQSEPAGHGVNHVLQQRLTEAGPTPAAISEGYGSAFLDGFASVLDGALPGRENQQRRQRIEAEAKQLSHQMESRRARFCIVADNLARAYDWGKFEPYVSEQEVAALSRCYSEGDLDCLARILVTMRQRRPRDAETRITHNLVVSSLEETTVESMLALAEDCLDAAQLIPDARVYDIERHGCLVFATSIASDARAWEIQQGVSPLGSTRAGVRAVELYRQVLQIDPADSTGLLRAELAWQLMANNQLEEAFHLTASVWDLQSSDYGFVYQAACLMSRRGNYDRALELLEAAIEMGAWDTPAIRQDPHLMPLRGARGDEFDELLRVKTQWNVEIGVISDDIILTNNSAFSITSIELQVTLEQDDREWTLDLAADEILPGETFRWSGVVSIPANRLTNRHAILDCYELIQ